MDKGIKVSLQGHLYELAFGQYALLSKGEKPSAILVNFARNIDTFNSESGDDYDVKVDGFLKFQDDNTPYLYVSAQDAVTVA